MYKIATLFYKKQPVGWESLAVWYKVNFLIIVFFIRNNLTEILKIDGCTLV